MPARVENPPGAAVAATLPDALLDPHAYPHWPDEVELRETPIAWVFLAGERAYKVLKPLRERETLARRRERCAQEVQRNRRFAPSVYAGVVAIAPRGPDGLCLCPECDPRAVEYGVEMRRYDEDATLAARLAAGTVAEGDLTAVGEAVARAHADAPPAPAEPDGEWLGRVVEETVASLGQAGVAVIEPDRLSALARFARAALAGLAPELRARAAAGLVRECHGDLRAEHVLLDGSVELVGGLQPDRAQEMTDVAYDVAFLVMDLQGHDEALARALLRGYARAGGDAGSARLLDFLVALCALVRAKGELLRATGAQADRRRTRALALVALAERFAWRARLPRVVCVAGLTASGKSTLAAALGAAAQRPVIASDVVGRTAAGEERLGAAQYAREVSREVYDALGHAARGAVRTEGGAIVDATFRHPDDVAAFAAAAGGRPVSWIVCHAPPDVLLERAGRGGAASDADPAVVAGQIARSSGPLPLPAPPLAELETVRPAGRLLEELATTLDAALARGEAPDA